MQREAKLTEIQKLTLICLSCVSTKRSWSKKFTREETYKAIDKLIHESTLREVMIAALSLVDLQYVSLKTSKGK